MRNERLQESARVYVDLRQTLGVQGGASDGVRTEAGRLRRADRRADRGGGARSRGEGRRPRESVKEESKARNLFAKGWRRAQDSRERTRWSASQRISEAPHLLPACYGGIPSMVRTSKAIPAPGEGQRETAICLKS